MQKKREKEKLIGVDKNNYELIPRHSLGIFVLGDLIDNYLDLPHDFEHIDIDFYDGYEHDDYYFYKQDVTVWTINNKIDSVRCSVECWWQGKNLIGMLYEDFEYLVQQKPDSEDCEYVPISDFRGQNQKIYNFDDLGLMLWVWRKRIKTIIVSLPYKED